MFRDRVYMSELIKVNPGLEQQMRNWQLEQHRQAEDPFDWQAFRVVVSYVGASDPGEQPPVEFFWFTPPGGSPVSLPELVTASSSVPSARLVKPGSDPDAARTSSPRLRPGVTDVKYWR
jgi:hypothetical protein